MSPISENFFSSITLLAQLSRRGHNNEKIFFALGVGGGGVGRVRGVVVFTAGQAVN